MIANANPTDFISVGKACREFGLSAPTLRTILDKHESLSYRSMGGHRRVSRLALEQHLGLRKASEGALGKKVCVMTRISTSAQKTSLANQKESCLGYCAEHLPGLPIELNESIRSGMHVSHPAFVDFILKLCSGAYSHIVANHTERICRSSLPLVRALCEKFNVQLHIVNRIDDKDADDFVADILAYTMYYNAKYNSSKSAKLTKVDISESDLIKIYKQYRQGMSYMDLEKYCDANGIQGVRNGRNVKLSHAKIHQMLSRNQKILEELVPENTSHVADFAREKLVNKDGYITKQIHIYDSYVKWCGNVGVTPLSVKKMGLELKKLGYRAGKGLGGMKVWKGVNV